jgi:hypothetical protein
MLFAWLLLYYKDDDDDDDDDTVGKISRKRGTIYSAGYIAVQEEASYLSFLGRDQLPVITIYISMYLSVSIYRSIHLPTYLSIHLFIYLSIYLFHLSADNCPTKQLFLTDDNEQPEVIRAPNQKPFRLKV